MLLKLLFHILYTQFKIILKNLNPKIYHPCIILTKKHYVGQIFEKESDRPGTIDSKGIETIRKDSCEFVAEALNKCLQAAFTHKSPLFVSMKLEQIMTSTLRGEVGLEKFFLSTEFKGKFHYSTESRAPVLEIVK